MVSIPLYIFLFIYLFFLSVFLSFIFVDMYHLVSGGSLTFASFLVTFVVLAGSAFTLYATWGMLAGVDWQLPVVLFRSDWFSNWFSLS